MRKQESLKENVQGLEMRKRESLKEKVQGLEETHIFLLRCCASK